MPSDARAQRLTERLPETEGLRFWRAPGRVNIIGEHVDYAGGLVLPFACDLDVLLACVPHPEVVLDSLDEPGTATVALDGSDAPSTGWGRYVGGVARALAEAGLGVSGVRGVLGSTIPVGAGLSSSAALEAAVALALGGGTALRPELLQRAEHLATGVPCGIMDQVAVLRGRREHAILLDCETGRTEFVPVPETLGFVVVDTGTRRTLDDGRYAARRTEVEGAVRVALEHTGARSLRALGPRDLGGLTAAVGGSGFRRLRHVVTEIGRVALAASALGMADLPSLGRLVSGSHASLRDDFDVSSAELDRAVETVASHPACHGARLVGAGFAGCVLALVERGSEPDVSTFVTGRLPSTRAFGVRAVDGAGPARV